MDAQLCCTTWYSCQGLSQTLPVKNGCGLFQGSDCTQCKGIDLLWEPQPVPGPTHHVKQQGEQKFISQRVTVSGWNVMRTSVCVHFLQLSANPAVACMAPVWSPTNASARKAGMGDTAIKVSEKQTLRVVSEVLHTQCYTEMTASRPFPASLMIPHSFFSNL